MGSIGMTLQLIQGALGSVDFTFLFLVAVVSAAEFDFEWSVRFACCSETVSVNTSGFATIATIHLDKLEDYLPVVLPY